jgi:predicted amidohydrolase
MSRVIRVGAAQLGPIQLADTRGVVVDRMLALMDDAHADGCTLVVYPELALTTFFPRWDMSDPDEIDAFYERGMPGPDTQPLFDRAKSYGIGFSFGYAELIEEDGATHRYNTSIIVEPDGAIVAKYRKVHLPGHADLDNDRSHQHLEKKYFEVGNLGFPVWRTMDGLLGMCICNDRRWPETFRVMGLQGVEMVLLGYNTPTANSQRPDERPETRMFHNHLSMQAGAYQNSAWVVGVAKAGVEDGHPLMGGTVVVAPNGEIVAQAETVDDELVIADCDLDAATFGKETMFNFAAHRRIEHYGTISTQTGVQTPD